MTGAPMPDERTREVIEQFNRAFRQHDPGLLTNILAPDCLLENSGPAPGGTRHVGYDECLRFWSSIAADEGTTFVVEELWTAGERAVCRWLLRWGPGADDFVRGVNVTRLENGLIAESFGYVKA
ncbi:nuclear transport factor 2 family protein [Streptomyces sp. NPDC051130]|uniref:nuclear transport factor 2 family protein n=1 Tax=Streptomyces sp. NPDC051130 TaxID=3157223 RepID=UPI00341BA4E6